MYVAHQVLNSLLKDFSNSVTALNGERPLPVEIDNLGYAVLLLVNEHENLFKEIEDSGKKINEAGLSLFAQANPDELSDDEAFFSYKLATYDEMPLLLAASIIKERIEVVASGELFVDALTHGDSTLRLHMMPTAWLIRARQDREKIVPALLKNGADTLGYIEQSFGLAHSFFDSKEEFFTYARESYTPPPRFAKQYQDRLLHVEERNLLPSFLEYFYKFEIRIRQLVESSAMRLDISLGEQERSMQMGLRFGG